MVSFAHSTVMDFLETGELSTPVFRLHRPDSRLFVFQACLAYISYYDSAVDKPPNRRAYPLLHYVCTFMGSHAAMVGDSNSRMIELKFNEALQQSQRIGYAFIAAYQNRHYRPLTQFPLANSVDSILDNVGDELRLQDYLVFSGNFDIPDDQVFIDIVYKSLAWARLLLDGGTDINLRRNISKRCMLSFAVEQGYYSLVEMLLGREGIDLGAVDSSGRTILSWAMSGGHSPIIPLLFDRISSQAELPDHFGQTIMHWGVRRGDIDLLEWLLSNPPFQESSQINARDLFGWTPLAYAVSRDNPDVVQILLSQGNIDLNPRDNHGRTPLMLAEELHLGMVVSCLRAHPGFESTTLSLIDWEYSPEMLLHGEDHEAGSSENTKNIWTSTEISVDGEAWYVRFSHDGKQAFCGGNAASYYFNLTSLPEHVNTINTPDLRSESRDAVWVPEDSSVIICGEYPPVRIFNSTVRSLFTRILPLSVRLTLSFIQDATSSQQLESSSMRGSQICIRPLPDSTYRIVLGSLEPKENSILDTNSEFQDVVVWTTRHCTLVLDVSTDGRWLVAGDHVDSIWIYQCNDRRLLYKHSFDILICSIYIARDSRHVLLRDVFGKIRLFDIATRTIVQTYVASNQADNCLIVAKFGGRNDIYVISGSTGRPAFSSPQVTILTISRGLR